MVRTVQPCETAFIRGSCAIAHQLCILYLVTVSARGTGTGEINQATVMAGAPLITGQPMAPMQLGQGHIAFQQQFIPVHASPAHPGYSQYQVPVSAAIWIVNY